MLDFGWAELLIILAVAVFVIGPKDIPSVMLGLGRLVKRFQYIKYTISQQVDTIVQASDIDELQKNVNFESDKPVRDDEDIQEEVKHDQP